MITPVREMDFFSFTSYNVRCNKLLHCNYAHVICNHCLNFLWNIGTFEPIPRKGNCYANTHARAGGGGAVVPIT